jgi:hypothetical protein
MIFGWRRHQVSRKLNCASFLLVRRPTTAETTPTRQENIYLPAAEFESNTKEGQRQK